MRYLILLLILIGSTTSHAQENSALVNGTLTVTEQGATTNYVVGQSSGGTLTHVGIGTGLELVMGTLRTVGGGIVFSDITPDHLVGCNASGDTITDVKSPYWDKGGPGSGIYEVNNTRLQNDTMFAMPASYFQGYEVSAWTKSLDTGVTDTLNIDPDYTYDFTEAGGRYTYVQPPQYDFEKITDFNWEHVFRLNASISIRTATAGKITLAIHQEGAQLQGCVAEVSLSGSQKLTHVTISCLTKVIDGKYLDVRLTNDEASTQTYIIERANFNANQIKSIHRQDF